MFFNIRTCRVLLLASTLCLAAVVVLFSRCSKKPERETAPITTDTLSVTTDTLSERHDTLSVTTDTLPAAPSDTFINKRDGQKYRIQAVYEPRGYRVDNYNEIPDTTYFIGLFREKDGYYLKPTNVSFVKGKDDCTYGLNLALTSDAVFLFSNFTGYNEDKITSVKLDSGKTMLPNEKFAFDFGDKRYELKAGGERHKEERYKEYEDCVENYSLVFSEKGTGDKQTIVSIPRTEYSVPKLLFIGDLDGDGKPDVILNAQSHYENRYIMVFLSSTAKKGEFLRLEAEKPDWFDC